MMFDILVTAFWMSALESKRPPFKRDTLFGTKSNQQVLNLANKESGRAQSHFVGPKTAWRLSRCGTGRCRAKGTSHQIHTWQGVIHKEFVPEGETISAVYYKGVMEKLLNRIRRVRPGMCENGDWFLLYDNALSHNATIVKQFLAQRNVTVLDHSPYSPDFAPTDYFLFRKVKSHLKGGLFDSISDIQKAVTSTSNTIAKDDFYTGIQKLYDRANLCL